MKTTRTPLNLLPKYATFLRYCVVGVLASGVFYCVANVSTLILERVDSRSCDEKSGVFRHIDICSTHTANLSHKAQIQNIATLLGSLASFIFGYFAQMRLAFRAYPNHSTMLPRYFALLALIAIYAQLIAYLGSLLALSYYLISAFIALSVPLFSYPLQKLWVFAKTSKGGGQYELARVYLQSGLFKLYSQLRFCFFRFYLISFLLALLLAIVCLYHLYRTFYSSIPIESNSHLRYLLHLFACKSTLECRFLIICINPFNSISKEYL